MFNVIPTTIDSLFSTTREEAPTPTKYGASAQVPGGNKGIRGGRRKVIKEKRSSGIKNSGAYAVDGSSPFPPFLPYSLIPLLLLTLIPLFLSATTRRYRLTYRDNPASSVTIGFEHFRGSNVRVVYDTQDHGQKTNAYRLSASPARTVNHAGMRNVFVRLGKLKSGTTYYFLVVDTDGASRRMIFETPPDDVQQPLSIIAGGDSRNNRATFQAANRIVAQLQPHFILFGGDMTDNDTAGEWQAWFDDWQLTISPEGRLTPIVPARGNHERNNASIYNLFDVPNPDVYYALSFGGGLLRTYTLNTLFPAGGDQLAWLASDLSRSKAMYKIAQYHHSMRPHTARKPERDELVRFWATQFFKHGLNLVIESDVHTVKQTWPIRPSKAEGAFQDFVRDDRRGTVYVGEGCWGAPLRANNDDKPWTRSSGRFNQFKWIWVSLQDMQVRTVDIDRSRGIRQGLSPQNRFQVPQGLTLWNPAETGPVLTIPRRGAPTRPGTEVAQARRPAPAVRPRPVPNMANAGPPKVLTRDAKGGVTVPFQLTENGAPQILIVDKGMNLLFQQKLTVRGPGPYGEYLLLSTLPPAQGMELVVKAGGRVVAKYGLR